MALKVKLRKFDIDHFRPAGKLGNLPNNLIFIRNCDNYMLSKHTAAIVENQLSYSILSDYYKSLKQTYFQSRLSQELSKSLKITFNEGFIDIVKSQLSSSSFSLTDQIFSTYNNGIKLQNSQAGSGLTSVILDNHDIGKNTNVFSKGLQFPNKLRLDERHHALDAIVIAYSESDYFFPRKFPEDLKENYKNKIDNLKKEIKLVRKLLIGHKRKKVLGYCYVIDRRMTFRTKIKFLFKNLDDCSDSNNVLEFKNATTLLNRTIKINEKSRYCKILARAA